MNNQKFSSPCCAGGDCGPASKPPASRYPVPIAGHELPTKEGWKRAANAMDQFASYGSTEQPVDNRDDPDAPWEYSGARLNAIQFPLGGFGTGQILLQGDGTLQGWTIQNEFHNAEYTPLHKMPNNFFAISAKPAGGAEQTFVLATPANYTEANCKKPHWEEAHVTTAAVKRLQDLPGIKGLTMTAKYPIVEVDYEIPGLPVAVSMEAMTPLIPNDAKNSSFPVAQFAFTVKNTGTTAVDVRLMQALQNFIGWDGKTDCVAGPTPFWGNNVNTPFVAAGVSGLSMTSTAVTPAAYNYGQLVIAAMTGGGTASKTGVIPAATSEADLFAQFSGHKEVDPATAAPTRPSTAGLSWAGAATHAVTVPANGTATVTFLISWYLPNRPSYSARKNLPSTLGNMYQNWFTDATDCAKQYSANSASLLATTREFRDIMYGSSVPWQFTETAAGRLACMRSPTMWWTKEGWVLGNEGNNCCPLNCSHVYGYVTLLEKLYPDLAKDMRVSDFVRNYDVTNGCTMRFGAGGFAIDGSLANVIKTWLVVRQDDPEGKWLPTVWPNVKAMMELGFKNFDTAGDGMFRCEQQNTYDTAMQGPNTFIGSYWVVALKATAAMAAMMGDADYAKKCADRAVLSAKNYEATCWNDKFGYYIADVTAANSAHSYGPGCFIDQLCAIGLSTACGMGTIFDPAHEALARKAILKYNKVTKPPFQDLQKHFYDGDSGVTVCSYPNGKLGNGMQYTTLVSIGFTYPVVAGMIYDRNIEDATTIAGMIRARHDGRNRSPWNEPECGLLYSRAMAGWNLFDQACGLVYDSTTGHMGFDPRSDATKFNCFVSASGGWGEFTQTGPAGLASGTATLRAAWGSISLKTLGLVSTATHASFSIDGGASTPAVVTKGVVSFGAQAVTLKTGSILTVTLASAWTAMAVPARQTVQECCPGGTCRPSDTDGGLRQRKQKEAEAEACSLSQAMVDEQQAKAAGSPSFFRRAQLIIAALLVLLFGIWLGMNLDHSVLGDHHSGHHGGHHGDHHGDHAMGGGMGSGSE